MKATAIYTFRRFEDSTRFELIERKGEVVKMFPDEWKLNKKDRNGVSKKGRKYIGFRKPDVTSPYIKVYPMLLEYGNGTIFTGLKTSEMQVEKYFGNTKSEIGDHAVLCERFADDILKVYFFFGMKTEMQTLYVRWLKGEEITVDTTEMDSVSLSEKKENAPKDEKSLFGA